MIWDALCALAIAGVLYVLVKYVMALMELSNYPPGPFPLPLIGNLHLLGGRPEQSFKELSKKYGDVMSLSFGSQRIVAINGIRPGKLLYFFKATERSNDYILKLLLFTHERLIFTHTRKLLI